MKTVVIYWSGTGNTKAMAIAVAEGAGAELFLRYLPSAVILRITTELL